jgi:hypothetical protein
MEPGFDRVASQADCNTRVITQHCRLRNILDKALEAFPGQPD